MADQQKRYEMTAFGGDYNAIMQRERDRAAASRGPKLSLESLPTPRREVSYGPAGQSADMEIAQALASKGDPRLLQVLLNYIPVAGNAARETFNRDRMVAALAPQTSYSGILDSFRTRTRSAGTSGGSMNVEKKANWVASPTQQRAEARKERRLDLMSENSAKYDDIRRRLGLIKTMLGGDSTKIQTQDNYVDNAGRWENRPIRTSVRTSLAEQLIPYLLG